MEQNNNEMINNETTNATETTTTNTETIKEAKKTTKEAKEAKNPTEKTTKKTKTKEANKEANKEAKEESAKEESAKEESAKEESAKEESAKEANKEESTKLKRANRISVNATDDGIYTATFYKTHQTISTISSTIIPTKEWTDRDMNSKDTTKTQVREDWRTYVIVNSKKFGVDYDPEDRRAPINQRCSSYPTDEILKTDVISMITPDINRLINSMPNSNLVTGYEITIDLISPMTTTSKGSDLSAMGIIDGKYAKTGNWAWANLHGTVAIATADNEIYEPIQIQLVSGQLKKFQLTHTQWNMDITRSFEEVGIIPTKEEKDAGKSQQQENKNSKKPTEKAKKEQKTDKK